MSTGETIIFNAMSTDEKRHFPRLPIFSAALITRDGQGWLSEVRDLSQGGACMGRPAQWVPSEHAECRIYFIFDQETVIAVVADCVREDDEDLGFEFRSGQEPAIGSLLYESNFIDKNNP